MLFLLGKPSCGTPEKIGATLSSVGHRGIQAHPMGVAGSLAYVCHMELEKSSDIFSLSAGIQRPPLCLLTQLQH